MTTTADHGGSTPFMLVCPLEPPNLYPSLVLALRDMRTANGRDEVTGDGPGNESWIGLALGMTVLDSMTPANKPMGNRLTGLLTSHGIDADDARIIVALRDSLLHGYGLPSPDRIGGRKMVLVREHDRPALDTSMKEWAVLSVPIFCGHLVERIVSEAQGDWDRSLIDTNAMPGWTGPHSSLSYEHRGPR